MKNIENKQQDSSLKTNISIITLFDSGYIQLKGRLSDYIKKTRRNYMLTKIKLLYRGTDGLKAKGWKKICHVNSKCDKVGMTLLDKD